jgi:O-antigen polysaccharide polymerase Wzy
VVSVQEEIVIRKLDGSMSHTFMSGSAQQELLHASRRPAILRRQFAAGVLKSHLFVTGLSILLLLLKLANVVSIEAFIYATSVFTIVLFAWSMWSWRAVTGSLFDPYALFLLSAYFFNGSLTVLEVLHLNASGMLYREFKLETIRTAMVLVTIGLAAFHLGALVVATRDTGRQPNGFRKPTLQPVPQDLRMVGWGLVAMSALPASFLFREWVALRLTAGYSVLYQQEPLVGLDTWQTVVASFLVPGSLFLLAGSKERAAGTVVSAICMVSLCMTWFFLGARSRAAMPLIAYAWVWHTCIRPLPRVLLIAAGVALLFVVFPVVSYIRQNPGSEQMSLASLQDAYLSMDNPTVSIISDMGGSGMGAVAGTLELVPTERPFDFGVGYVHALLNIIPNFLTPLHFDLEYGTPDAWYVNMVDPARARAGGGLGYSFIAEAYLAFGWIGAPIVLGLLGAFVARLWSWTAHPIEPAKIAAVGAYLSFFLHYARGCLEGYTRQFVWYAIVPYALVYVACWYRHSMQRSKPTTGAGSDPVSRSTGRAPRAFLASPPERRGVGRQGGAAG